MNVWIFFININYELKINFQLKWKYEHTFLLQLIVFVYWSPARPVLTVHKHLSSLTMPSTSLLEYTAMLYVKLIIIFVSAGDVTHLNLSIKVYYYRDTLYLTNAEEEKLFSMQCFLKKKNLSLCPAHSRVSRRNLSQVPFAYW